MTYDLVSRLTMIAINMSDVYFLIFQSDFTRVATLFGPFSNGMKKKFGSDKSEL